MSSVAITINRMQKGLNIFLTKIAVNLKKLLHATCLFGQFLKIVKAYWSCIKPLLTLFNK